MFIRVYLRASTEEQDARRGQASLEQFASDQNGRRERVSGECERRLRRPAQVAASAQRCAQG